MRPETKARQKLSWSMLLIILAGAMLLLIPIWPEKLLIVYAVLFWALMIAAYVLLFLVNRWRRADQKAVECPDEYCRGPGAFRRGGTAVTVVLAVLAAISLVFVLVRTVSHAPAAMIDYAAAAVFFTTVQLRAIAAGRNWRYTKYKRTNRNKRRSTKE